MELIPYLTVSDSVAIDRTTIQKTSINGDILMENAGQEMGRLIRKTFPQEKEFFILCGIGNNGGDGLVVARHLAKYKLRPLVGIWGNEKSNSSDLFALNLRRLKDFKVAVHYGQEWNHFSHFKKTPVWIDALFGTGLNRVLDEQARFLIEKINTLKVKRVALDIPSGLPTFWREKTVFKADVTLTVGSLKDIFLYPWFQEFVGEVQIVPVDFPNRFIQEKAKHLTLPISVEADKSEVSHKSTFGKSLIIAGSCEYPGAAILSAKAALINGSSYLFLASPRQYLPTIPETIPLDWGKHDYLEGSHFSLWSSCIEQCRHILLGPGLGRHKKTAEFFEYLFSVKGKNIILDADALWHITSYLSKNNWKNFAKNNSVILTPHLQEFANLWSKPINEIKKNFFNYLEKTKMWKCQVLVKDAYLFYWNHTKSYYFPFPNRYLAKAGSGDILAGFILGGFSHHNAFETATVQAILKYIQKAKHMREEFGVEAPISLMTETFRKIS